MSVINELRKSKGHLLFLGNLEFFHCPDGLLYKADRRSPIGLDDGYRVDARFECHYRSDGHKDRMAIAWRIDI